MKKNWNCKVYSEEKLNNLKGVIRVNRELSLATSEEIQSALGTQRVMDGKTITIISGKETQKIQIHFNICKSIIHMEVKIGYYLKKVTQNNSAPFKSLFVWLVGFMTYQTLLVI